MVHSYPLVRLKLKAELGRHGIRSPSTYRGWLEFGAYDICYSFTKGWAVTTGGTDPRVGKKRLIGSTPAAKLVKALKMNMRNSTRLD